MKQRSQKMQHLLEVNMTKETAELKILLADDDPELVSILVKRLGSLQTTILTASDGVEALSIIRNQHPDVVVLDVMMPKKNGWEVCKEIRESSELKDTGVIMLTGIGEHLNEMTSPLYGADEYLDKPFNFAELVFKIKRLLNQRQRISMDS